MVRALRFIGVFAFIAVFGLAAPACARSRGSNAVEVEKRYKELLNAGNYAAALIEAQTLEPLIRAQSGTRSFNYVVALWHIGACYTNLDRHSEAVQVYKLAIPILDTVRAPDHIPAIAMRNEFAGELITIGKYAEAEEQLRQALAILDRAPDVPGPPRVEVFLTLGRLYIGQGRYRDAEEADRRALAMYGSLPADANAVAALQDWANALQYEGRYAESELLYKRGISLGEQVLGPNHKTVALGLLNLGALYANAEGRNQEAIALYKRALSIFHETVGDESDNTAMVLNNLAAAYSKTGQYAELADIQLQALAIQQRVLGADNPDVAVSLNNVGGYYADQGRWEDAERFYLQAIAIWQRISGEDNPQAAVPLAGLGDAYRHEGKYAEAEAVFKKALTLRETAFGPGHPGVAGSLGSLSVLAQERGLTADALAYSRKAAALLLADAAVVSAGQTQAGGQGLLLENSLLFRLNAVNLAMAAQKGMISERDAGAEAFEMAQWASQSSAAAAVAQLGLRFAAGSDALAMVVRENQDLLAAWNNKDKALTAALSQLAGKRDSAAIDGLRKEIAGTESRLAALSAQIQQRFPDYAALAKPKALKTDEVQAQLRPDEALVLFADIDTPEETFIWVVTKTDMRWVRSDLGTAALTREVQALRCGLDKEAWADDGWQKCHDLTQAEPVRQDGEIVIATLPFDLARAHRLYQALFGQAEDLIKGKSLIVVPSGPLTQLPFQVLLTQPPKTGDVRSAAWLVRDHALTVLPAVSSLKALRRVARPSGAKKTMIGFGNPLLDGDPADEDDRQRAQDARDFKRCPVPQLVASNERSVRGVAPIVTRGGLASVSQIRSEPPLPETAQELCDVARDVHADLDGIYLGARATEREIKHLSETGQLAQYRIVHFATHGALSGQIEGNSEPGLLLTPPAEASEDDDGYLTASEIAGLKLDADWAILSACNTAAGGAQGAEALSGLARAFIYAQARALLVSHWEVASGATVKLITGAMRRLAADKSMGRAEAMRQSMLDLIDHGERQEAHPAFWAPFVLVGEGAAAR